MLARTEPATQVIELRRLGGVTLPEPFDTLLSRRRTRLIYVGKRPRLRSACLELRERGHGTSFCLQTQDRGAMVEWVNNSLEVDWAAVPEWMSSRAKRC